MAITSLRVGDKVEISFRELMTNPDTGEQHKGIIGTILALDERGVRFQTENDFIQWLPWDLMGSTVIKEEAKKQHSKIQAF